MAIAIALTAKRSSGRLVIVDSLGLPTHKTAGLEEIMKNNKWRSAFICDGTEIPVNLTRASNILYENVEVLTQPWINTYSILHKEYCILSLECVKMLHQWFASKQKGHFPTPTGHLTPPPTTLQQWITTQETATSSSPAAPVQ